MGNAADLGVIPLEDGYSRALCERIRAISYDDLPPVGLGASDEQTAALARIVPLPMRTDRGEVLRSHNDHFSRA